MIFPKFRKKLLFSKIISSIDGNKFSFENRCFQSDFIFEKNYEKKNPISGT